ncbi:vWA domain-containing protein [Saccharopolyspora elongata]|uniref:VWA domain-containing protein n=1 Tax=Saccharopolyspora elongata TaxID=2530387 RepID=A0A4R4YW55_9PSEU|nr:vWA domain-containing protein [Saccharopolyspora elongata]TDD49661.1 VWA domain-containing protein [Saccharopolyspora elongata]
MSSWIRRDFGGIGLTQAPPGEFLPRLQERYGGHVLLCIDVSASMHGQRLEQAIAGGERFLAEADGAHYKSGLVLWSDVVQQYVPPEARLDDVVSALRKAKTWGGTVLSSALQLGIEVLPEYPGDRVLCIFSDGALGDHAKARELARKACAMGIRIVVRGLGPAAADSLADLACPGVPDADQQIDDAAGVAAGIASMATGLSARRGR